jgi:DNA-binding NarL/FixJ family response regulator
VIGVVIADDAEDLRMLVRISLVADPRFDVLGEAADGVEALELVESQDPDVLLLDLGMPRMDGLEVLEHLRRRARAMPVVVFSGYTSDKIKQQALDLGAVAFIEKGADLDSIPGRLAEAALG